MNSALISLLFFVALWKLLGAFLLHSMNIVIDFPADVCYNYEMEICEMKLKESIDYALFLNTVRNSGDVYFKTKQGNSLNLKSELCRYIFVTAARTSDFAFIGDVVFENDLDKGILTEFLA
jgi:hypothetical protein